MGNTPAITVLMSVYNAEKYIQESIDSILQQTFTDFEFIIYNDNSNDNTGKILSTYTDPRIKVLINSENKGLTYNLNHGVEHARGKYVARMDADDIAVSNRLEIQYQYLEKHPEISILGGQVHFFINSIDDEGPTTHEPLDNDSIRVQLLLGFSLYHPTVMFRVDDLKLYNLNYDISFRYSQDLALWSQAMHYVKLANLPKIVTYMREHPNKISIAKHSLQKECSDRVHLQELKRLGVTNLSNEEQISFLSFCACETQLSVQSLIHYDAAIDKIRKENSKTNFFNDSILLKIALNKYKYACYYLIKEYGEKSNILDNTTLGKLIHFSLYEKCKLIFFRFRKYCVN